MPLILCLSFFEHMCIYAHAPGHIYMLMGAFHMTCHSSVLETSAWQQGIHNWVLSARDGFHLHPKTTGWKFSRHTRVLLKLDVKEKKEGISPPPKGLMNMSHLQFFFVGGRNFEIKTVNTFFYRTVCVWTNFLIFLNYF